MSNPQKQPNIYDVAKLAQVSHQTVSRVINNYQGMKPATRERVEVAMETLGYRPNPAARALATSKTNIVGILASDTDFTGPARMVHHMERAARKAQFFAVTAGIDPTSENSVEEGIEYLQNLGIEGLVVVTPQTTAVDIARAKLKAMPVITIDSMYRMDEQAISIDNFSGATAATQHLIDLGHTAIIHVSGPKLWFESNARMSGYSSTMLNASLVPNIIDGDWSIDTGYRIGMQLNIDEPGVTAIFAANDYLALGLMHAFKLRGISVPNRISIVGFDDLPETPYYSTPLTTVRQDFELLGTKAMELLLDRLSGKKRIKHDRITPELVVRDSTSFPARLKK
jgi:DNA-binding LacI/PurR family transcriptional regulator